MARPNLVWRALRNAACMRVRSSWFGRVAAITRDAEAVLVLDGHDERVGGRLALQYRDIFRQYVRGGRGVTRDADSIAGDFAADRTDARRPGVVDQEHGTVGSAVAEDAGVQEGEASRRPRAGRCGAAVRRGRAPSSSAGRTCPSRYAWGNAARSTARLQYLTGFPSDLAPEAPCLNQGAFLLPPRR
jgi:hypothetical protein